MMRRLARSELLLRRTAPTQSRSKSTRPSKGRGLGMISAARINLGLYGGLGSIL
jgi:hypothetical protein